MQGLLAAKPPCLISTTWPGLLPLATPQRTYYSLINVWGYVQDEEILADYGTTTIVSEVLLSVVYHTATWAW